MPDQKISSLPSGAPVQMTDTFVIARAGVNYRVALADIDVLVFNTVGASGYTLVLTDIGKAVTLTSAAGCSVVVPPNSSVAFPVGTQIILRAGTGAGAVVVSGGTGVTVTNPYGSLTLAGPGAQATLLKIGPDAWSLNGEVA